ncbi:MAG: hypothetical protein ACI97A_002511 [Planctomycetota bacterium]|jgi:hypothetical protein
MLGGCAASVESDHGSHHNTPTQPITGLSIRLDDGAPEMGDELVGWIYASNNIDGEPNRCVYVWRNKSWTIADETVPGYYDSNKATGSFSLDGQGHWVSSGFLPSSFANYSNVNTAGGFGAIIGDRAIVRNQ